VVIIMLLSFAVVFGINAYSARISRYRSGEAVE